jgi:hypothetical protein
MIAHCCPNIETPTYGVEITLIEEVWHWLMLVAPNVVVDFPTSQLDLSDYVLGPTSAAAPPVYELYGVSEHFGGMGGGHYTAKCQNPINGCWYSFNDSSVTETTAKVQ